MRRGKMDTTQLKACPLFRGLNDREIHSVVDCLNAQNIAKEKGEYLLQAGDVTNDMGILLSGSALIIQEDIWGNRSILSKLIPGDICAECFAASRLPMTVSVLAETDIKVLMINVNRLLTVCSNRCEFHNRLICNLVSVMSGKMLTSTDKITHMSKRTTEEKILSYLSSQAQKHGSLTFDIPFDRQELADYLGVERAAMSAVLSGLQKQGKIQYRKNHFVLIKLE